MATITLHPGTDGDHTRILQQAIDTAVADGSGTVILEAGLYRAGTLHLRSGLRLVVGWGAVLKAADRMEAFEHLQSPLTSRLDAQPWAVFISAVGLHDVRIEGPGTIDGNGRCPGLHTGLADDPRRPYCIFAIDCTNLTVENIFLRDSAYWMQRYLGCTRLRLHRVKVFNHANLNSDGMDLDGCEDVLVSDCDLDASDDVICLKSEGARPCRNISVTNCHLASHASAFKLGTGSLAGFEHVNLSNCIFKRSRSTHMAHMLALWQGIAGIDLGSVDGGYMRHITVDNVVIEGYLAPIYMHLGRRHSRGLLGGQGYGEPGKDPRPLRRHTGEGLPPIVPSTLEHVIVRGITARDTGPMATSITGYAGHPCRHITLSDIDMQLGPAGCPEDLTDPIDWHEAGYPVACSFTVIKPGQWPPRRWHGLPAYGLLLRYAEDITLRNVRFHPAHGDPRPELSLHEGVARVWRDGVPLVA
jgi:hypothetical protein